MLAVILLDMLLFSLALMLAIMFSRLFSHPGPDDDVVDLTSFSALNLVHITKKIVLAQRYDLLREFARGA